MLLLFSGRVAPVGRVLPTVTVSATVYEAVPVSATVYATIEVS